MKVLLFADLHMCPQASIINKWGTKYTKRLENCINTVNWLERLAEERDCDCIINLGDFFDRPDLSSETITACKEIEWSDIKHYSLVGNHDASTSSLEFNSVNILKSDLHEIVTVPEVIELADCYICFLPYVTECDRKPLQEYFAEWCKKDKPKIILSHNDISGIQLGPVVSKTGFSLSEIEDSCELFLNGHLHNGQSLSDKVINIGNMTGKDFGEDANKHSHEAVILDTETLELEFIENPNAFNFYKLQIDCEDDMSCFDILKNNAVVSVKCVQSMIERVRQKIENTPNITESRIILIRQYEELSDTAELNLTVDHLARFIDCCRESIENSNILEEELSVICK